MGKRGRPAKAPSDDDRAKVAELLRKKVPVEDLAKMFGMSKPTFRKYFLADIITGKKTGDKRLPYREVTDTFRAKVQRYLGLGMEPEDIALVLGYTGEGEYEHFRADYAFELRIGRAMTRAAMLDRLDEQSKGGLIGATTKLEALSRPVATKDGPAAAPAEYIGKKAAAKADAASTVSGGGKFAPRGAPRLVASGGKPISPP